MKTATEINQHLRQCRKGRMKLLTQHNDLNQIDMQSGGGYGLQKKIANYEGQIDALNWVLSGRGANKFPDLPDDCNATESDIY
jgi:hypothetical protein